MKSLFILIICLPLFGCATYKLEAPRPPGLLTVKSPEEQITVRSVTVVSEPQAIESKVEGTIIGGHIRSPFYPKEAREFLAQDLRDYLASRFRIDSSADRQVVLRLEQVQSYAVSWHNPMNWIPFVGVATSLADGFQQVPLTFQVEVRAEVLSPGTSPIASDAFVRRTDNFMGWSGTRDKMAGIFRDHLNATRREVFDRLDGQLVTLWREGRWVGETNERSSAATLASEIAKLDGALADQKISKEEHAKLIEQLKFKFAAPTPPI